MPEADEAFREQLAAIRGDRTSGAGLLAQRALWALAQVASAEGATLESVEASAKELAKVRPALASVANSVHTFLARLEDTGWDLQRAPALASRLITEAQQRAEEAANHAAALLPERGTVLTCSSSATVVRALMAAHRLGRRFDTLVLPSGGYGRLMAAEARQVGVTIAVVNTLPKGRRSDDTVGLIGADTVVTGECVINGAPSLGLARWCFDRDLPFYVVCDSRKVVPQPTKGGAPLPRGVERIPLRYITAIVTESGAQAGALPRRPQPVS